MVEYQKLKTKKLAQQENILNYTLSYSQPGVPKYNNY